MTDGLIWVEGSHWGLLTAAYLFFVGVAGGGYLVSVVAGALAERRSRAAEQETVGRWGALVALAAVAVAGGAILAHLADPLRGVLFPLTLTNFDSWITRGTWILVALGGFAGVRVLWLTFGTDTRATGPSAFPRRIAAVVGVLDVLDAFADRVRPGQSLGRLVAAAGVVPALATAYTGFELAVVSIVPLWHFPVLLPALFLVTGVAAGFAAATALTTAFDGYSRTVGAYCLVVAGFLVVSAALVWTGLTRLGASPSPAADTSLVMLGEFQAVVLPTLATLVGGAVVLVGVVAFAAPAPGGRRTRRTVDAAVVGSLTLVFVGSFLLRLAVLLAAVKTPLPGPFL